jgi:hypothetical protein
VSSIRTPPNDILLTGIPRSGTTLACALLNRIPNTVALNEPLNPAALGIQPNDDARRDFVTQFMASQRQSILTTGRATAMGIDGRICDNCVGAPINGTRSYLATKGEVEIVRPSRPDFYLLIKHPFIFTALLRPLLSRFPVYAIVRNPLATLGSMQSLVDTPHFDFVRGRMPAFVGRLHPKFAFDISQLPDLLDRLLYTISWFYAQYLEHLPPTHVIRYEEIIATQGKTLATIIPEAADLNQPLESRNHSKLYSQDQLRRICQRLIATGGEWRKFYSNDEILRLMQEYLTAGAASL